MITVQQFGAEAVAAYLDKGIREYKREQRKLVRKAAIVLQKAAVHELQNVYASRGAHKYRGKSVGPLDRSIGFKTFASSYSVGARVEYKMRGFYGRILETGVNKQVQVRETRVVFANGRFFTLKAGSSYTLNIKPRPILGPVAAKKENEVVEIMGDSFGVFYRGGVSA